MRRSVVAVAAWAGLLVVTGCTGTPAAPGPAPSSETAAASVTAGASSGVETTAAAGVPLAPELAPTATAPLSTVARPAPSTPAAGQGPEAGVDRSDPDAVTTAVLTTFYTADTTVDAGPNDAAARAVGLLTDDYATAIMTTPPVRGPGAQWTDWAARGVTLAPVLEALPDDRPDDSTDAAYRIYLITQTPTTGDGQALAPVVTVAYVQLLATPAGWAVARVDQR